MILQKASSQHIFRLLWCSERSLVEHFEGSTSQFSSDSYSAFINSPKERKIESKVKMSEGTTLAAISTLEKNSHI